MNLLITIISCLATAVIFFFLGRKSAMRTAANDAAKCQSEEAYREDPIIEEKPEEVIPAEEIPDVEPVAEKVEPVAAEVEPFAEEESPEEEPITAEEASEEESTAAEEAEDDANDKFVTQNQELVASLHKLLEEDKVFLHPDIRIDDVARMIYTNRTYITRMMRQEYGLTFIEYVNVARIQHSQHLLYSYNMTLEEVAIKSGFQSTSNYCRAFKRLIGTSPLAWIQQVKSPLSEE